MNPTHDASWWHSSRASLRVTELDFSFAGVESQYGKLLCYSGTLLETMAGEGLASAEKGNPTSNIEPI